MPSTTARLHRRLPVGAEVTPGGVHSRVWSPGHRRVGLVAKTRFDCESPAVTIELRQESEGYFSSRVPQLTAGAHYGFLLEGHSHVLPDPASRFQPQGPDGMSVVIDPSAFQWTDQNWKGIGGAGKVICEIAIRTTTPEKTCATAAPPHAQHPPLRITPVPV